MGGIACSVGFFGGFVQDTVGGDAVCQLNLDECIGLGFYEKLHALSWLCVLLA